MKKTAKPALQVAAISSGSLTPVEMRLICAYRKFDDDRQEFWLLGMETCAKDPGCGLRAIKPELRLVSGGAA